MLLRSSSTPILNSWIPQSKEEFESYIPQIPRSRSNSFTASLSPPPPPPPRGDDSIKKTNISIATTLRRRRSLDGAETKGKQVQPPPTPCSDVEKTNISTGRRSLDGADTTALSKAGKQQDVVVDGIYSKMFTVSGLDGGGGPRGWNGDGSSIYPDSSKGEDDNNSKMDEYYQSTIQANPGNDLLLGNYARFLKEVKADLDKAEEYCGRAILANPNNANFLSLYAEIIWKAHKDASRAECYFHRAVEVAPDDCYVMASYAHFLWDAEEEEEEDDGIKTYNHPLHTGFVQGVPLITAC